VQGVEDPADPLEIGIRRSLIVLYYSARASVSITLLARDSGRCGANLNP